LIQTEDHRRRNGRAICSGDEFPIDGIGDVIYRPPARLTIDWSLCEWTTGFAVSNDPEFDLWFTPGKLRTEIHGKNGSIYNLLLDKELHEGWILRGSTCRRLLSGGLAVYKKRYYQNSSHRKLARGCRQVGHLKAAQLSSPHPLPC